MPLRLYNTMTRGVDEFHPIEPGKVGMYTCGPTVYNYAHIGNLRTYVFEDILKRVLLREGYEVRHVMNVTDVGHLTSDADEGEDKMEKGAAREGKSVWEIAEFYWQAFKDDMKRLNLLPPDVWCRATDHIPEQVAMVQALEQKGFTYILEDGVYFDTAKLPGYGKLARLDVQGLKAGARIEMVQGKRNPTDFALWKFSPKDKKRQMEWESPWGVGFPGWHIECSAMALKYLGERVDIHCGGIDHVNVHHTNEIAQTESVTGKPWVNWWMHGEFLVMAQPGSADAGKMAKSAGGFITLDMAMKRGFDPLAYRYFCLNAHYRAQLAFSWEGLDGAGAAFERLRTRAIELRAEAASGAPVIGEYMDEFREAARDDLNMPRALAATWGLLRDSQAPRAEVHRTLLGMDAILGFGLDRIQERKAAVSREMQVRIEKLIAERDAARKAKDFARADEIRRQLSAMGFALEDTPKGTIWKKA